MTLSGYRRFAERLCDPFVSYLDKRGVTPDTISYFSLLFAVLAFLSYLTSSLLVAAFCVGLNGFLDLADGNLARRRKMQSPRGDFIDHVIDRYSDLLILTGIIAGGFVSEMWGILAIIGTLMTSYIGTQAQAVGLRRIYSGVMGRADRMALLTAATLLNHFHPDEILWNLSFLELAVIFIAVFGNLTALQRIHYAMREL
ncbi:MAG: archaetidylinositol phosphate synthase [Archaeoglobi archaeon]|nr:CDP-alcohol phosphatidyltransferase family protein [Candidatus Mnemosynella bozhongmuii]MDI3502161.1 archaetidylinositol phosphate synthase [Archaeoglobi archaeon]